MLDLGMQELILIFVVALLVFGPKKLPELSRALGKGVRELKIALRGVKDSFDEAGDQIEEEIYKEVHNKGVTEEEKSGESPDTPEKQDSPGTAGQENKERADNG